MRTGKKKLSAITGQEFQQALSKNWLKVLPKPHKIRFDDEGAFRDNRTLEWLEGQGIKYQFIGGEAAWQLGKHSRHLEVLKENMSLLALEQGPEISAEEILNLSLSAKNTLHNLEGCSPDQWAFGKNKEQMGSWLKFGDHPPMSSHRSDPSLKNAYRNIRWRNKRSSLLMRDGGYFVLRGVRPENKRSFR